ncbi:hypothetical protein [Demequina sp.]|uniref:hypothetical protein n=1 Tax=Demequina sp. TaxID=2050685 RepID=UPI003A88C956
MDNARSRPRGWVWIVTAIIAAGAIGVAASLLMGPNDDPTPDPSVSPSDVGGCAGIEAERIELDSQVVEPAALTCFELDERAQVSVGAAALEPDSVIVLTVLDADGEPLGTATSDEAWDPQVNLTLEPGSYQVDVRGPDGDELPFLIYTATFPAGDEPDVEPTASATADLPQASACGADVPEVTDGSPVRVDSDSATAHACLIVTEKVFAKVGLESADPSDPESPDLQLGLYQPADDDREATLVRSADDVIGFDPEMSLTLEPGTYMLEASAWYASSPGTFEFYVDTDGDLFRHGEVTAVHAGLTPDTCSDAPQLAVNEAMTVTGEGTYLCVEVPETARLVMDAASLTDQHLSIEVIGFDGGSAPFRLTWADGNPDVTALANFDPHIDQVIPAGTWLLAVAGYDGSVAADYDVQVSTLTR